MKRLEWSDKLNLGVPQIDNQHKELIRLVNGLISAVSLDRPEKTIKNVLKKLREYTVFHFNSEEVFMDSIGYDNLNKHVAEHIDLKKKVKEFQRSIYKGESVEVMTLLDFLKPWLLNHILESDREIAAFIKREKISLEHF
ncbi:bacteriohemerythrin [Maridesulfovibrio sp.]|uniref:bacteriohemerythrin n=1 Tax=unclassified Maridesulfovibrio TaxID=2794999 RepID=UPI003B00619C